MEHHECRCSFETFKTRADVQSIELDRHQIGADDQLDIRLLLKPELEDWRPTIPAFDRTDEIASWLEERSGETDTEQELQYAQ